MSQYCSARDLLAEKTFLLARGLLAFSTITQSLSRWQEEVMVDERPPLTEEQRRQRQKRLEQARRRTPKKGVEPVTADEAVPTNETDPKLDPPATRRRGRPKKPDVTAADVTGLKYFEKLAPLLERLHTVGCERDQAGNRELHYDQLCLLLLLGLFNPVVDSLRGLQQASELETVQKRLGLGRASLGSLSEASRVFDPELLQPIIEELAPNCSRWRATGVWPKSPSP